MILLLIDAGIAQLIERCLAKAEVAGLSPVSRSINHRKVIFFRKRTEFQKATYSNERVCRFWSLFIKKESRFLEEVALLSVCKVLSHLLKIQDGGIVAVLRDTLLSG